MRPILRFLKRIWLLNFVRRLYQASKVYNGKYGQILRWGFSSREDTNYTYNLTEASLLYLAHTISLITGLKPREVEVYFQELLSDEALKQTILEGIETSDQKRFADKEIRFGKRLGWYAMVRILRPKVVIETGVDKGLGAILLCAALRRNAQEGFEGRYYGTDINPEAGYLLRAPYNEVGEILYGDSIESLSKFPQQIDLFINDSDHSADYEYEEYRCIRPKLAPHSVILGDNAEATDKLARFSLEEARHFLFFAEEPAEHWYPGGGIGFSFLQMPAHLRKT